MEWLTALKDYVPLFQTVVWALLILILLSFFHKPLQKLLENFQQRIGGGNVEVSVGLFSLKLGELRNLEYIDPNTQVHPNEPIDNDKSSLPQNWTQTRSDIYQRNRDVFLVHILEPSKTVGQEFDIFIFLTRHGSTHRHTDHLIEIDYSEFFLGQGWKNRTFTIQNTGGPIGLRTSAFGPFLVICRVVFKDGYEIILDRYIDFEMGKKIITSSIIK